MRTWTATATAEAQPAAVLDVLTDPDACARWAPISFDVEEIATERLCAGSRARVSGRLAGRSVGFEVEVHEADESRLALSANGPLSLDVAYELAPSDRGSQVRASVSLRPGRGLCSRLLAEATGALLTAGALQHAVARIAREATLASAALA